MDALNLFLKKKATYVVSFKRGLIIFLALKAVFLDEENRWSLLSGSFIFTYEEPRLNS